MSSESWEPYFGMGVTLKLAQFEFVRLDVGMRRVGEASVEVEATKKGVKISAENRGKVKVGETPEAAFKRVSDVTKKLLAAEILKVCDPSALAAVGLAEYEEVKND